MHILQVKKGGVTVEEVKVGTGQPAQDRKKVYVHYCGRLNNAQGREFDRSRGKPFAFNLGKGQVIKGWDIGLAGLLFIVVIVFCLFVTL